MGALQGFEGPLSWIALHLWLIALPAMAGFLFGRRGRLHLWHVAALIGVCALILLPAAACVNLNRNPRAWPDAILSHLADPAGITLFGLHTPSWSTPVAALLLGLALGRSLFRSARREAAQPVLDPGP